MKNFKIVLFSLFLIGVVFTSCSKDDSDVDDVDDVVIVDNEVDGNIEGRWIFAKEGVLLNEQEILINYVRVEGCAKDFVEISTESVYKTVNYFGSECTEKIDSGKWVKDGNTLTVTYGEGTSAEVIKSTILLLTSSELKIKTTNTVAGNSIDRILLFTRAN